MANSLHVKMYCWDIGQVMKQTDVIKKFADETKDGPESDDGPGGQDQVTRCLGRPRNDHKRDTCPKCKVMRLVHTTPDTST
jgi:hypothetical protein